MTCSNHILTDQEKAEAAYNLLYELAHTYVRPTGLDSVAIWLASIKAGSQPKWDDMKCANG